MHPTLRYILTKATDLGAMSGVVQRMSGSIRSMFREQRPMSDNMSAGFLIIGSMTDNKGAMSGDMSRMSCDLHLMPYDIESMTDSYAGMSLVSLLKSLNPIALLRDMVAKLRYEINEWYWRKMGLSHPVQRKIYREMSFDDHFTTICVKDYVEEGSKYRGRFSRGRFRIHEIVEFLVAEKPVARDTKLLLAVLLVFARRVLGLTEHKGGWTLPGQLALQRGSGSSPLSPRPPPYAGC